MISGIIGRKMGMTQLFAEDGTVTPVTVIKAGPCVVVQTKSAAGRDGYNAVQLGLVEDKPVRSKMSRSRFAATLKRPAADCLRRVFLKRSA